MHQMEFTKNYRGNKACTSFNSFFFCSISMLSSALPIVQSNNDWNHLKLYEHKCNKSNWKGDSVEEGKKVLWKRMENVTMNLHLSYYLVDRVKLRIRAHIWIANQYDGWKCSRGDCQSDFSANSRHFATSDRNFFFSTSFSLYSWHSL